MELDIPSAAVVAQMLAPLRQAQLQRLSDLSGVPIYTLLKIKSRETANPGIETVRRFAPFIVAAQTERDAA